MDLLTEQEELIEEAKGRERFDDDHLDEGQLHNRCAGI